MKLGHRLEQMAIYSGLGISASRIKSYIDDVIHGDKITRENSNDLEYGIKHFLEFTNDRRFRSQPLYSQALEYATKLKEGDFTNVDLLKMREFFYSMMRYSLNMFDKARFSC